MGDGSLAIAVGTGLLVASSAVTLFVAVVDESLRLFHRATLFARLAASRHAEFESLLKREADYFIAVRIFRSLTYPGCLIGLLLLFGLGEGQGFSSTSVIQAAISTIVLFYMIGTLVPVILARHFADDVLLRFLPVFHLATRPLVPLVRLVNALSFGVTRVRGTVAEETPKEEIMDDIADHLDEAHREGVIGEGERKMIESLIDFGDTTVRQVMTPRIKMVCVDIEVPLQDAIDLAVQHGHSRLPVFEGSRDHIVGLFYVRDALRHWSRRAQETPVLRTLMRKPIFIHESKNIGELLAELMAARTHMAIVIDEHGGTEGLVTLEDIIEEIVGEIRDEFDESEAGRFTSKIAGVRGGGSIDLDAQTSVADVNDALGCDLPESEEYTSVAGLVSSRLGRIPNTGEVIPVNGINLQVIEATERMVTRVRITRRLDAETSQAH